MQLYGYIQNALIKTILNGQQNEKLFQLGGNFLKTNIHKVS